MAYTSSPIELVDIFKKLNEKKLVLPNFQREFLWSKSQQKSLLASFFIGLPIGSFLFLEGPKDEYPSKPLGKKSGIIDYEEIEYPEVEFLLDGQQRITTLKTIFTDIFKDIKNKTKFKEVHENTFGKITRRWFVRIKDENSDDFFGFDDLKFDEYKYKHTEPQDIESMFEYEEINRSQDEDKWYNPLYKFKNDLNDEEYRQEVIENASEEGRIPLFFLLETHSDKIGNEEISKKDTVVYNVLSSIANNEHNVNENIQLISKMSDWTRDVYEYLKGCLEKKLHIIRVPSEEKGRAIPIFEHINSGGTALDTFDLVVAKAADKSTEEHYSIYENKKQSLRQAIKNKLENNISMDDYKELKTDDMSKLPEGWAPKSFYFDSKNNMYKSFKTRYLSLLSLISNLDKYKDIDHIQSDFLKKSKALELNSKSINSNTCKVVKALINAGQFLQYRCGFQNINDSPYKLMLMPIAYVMLDDDFFTNNTKEKLNLLEVWYWYSIFSGTYRDNKNKRCIKDIKLLYKVIIEEKVGEFKEFIKSYQERFLNFDDYSDKNTLINNNDVPSAIEKTIKQYILSRCPQDLLENSTRICSWDIANDSINIEFHHIIPLGSNLDKVKESTRKLRNNSNHILNSPLNLTPILRKTNAKISSMALNNYLGKVSNLSKKTHCLPIYTRGELNEVYKANGTFYRGFLEKRFDILKTKMENEFKNLLSNLRSNINF